MLTKPPAVTWLNEAQRGLTVAVRDRLVRELCIVFAQERPKRIVVTQRFRGFVDVPEDKVILAVETQSEYESRASVVKIGRRNEILSDHEGWRSCAAQYGVASRMFIAPMLREISDERAAVVYPNVYQFYYDEGHNVPSELEDCVQRAVRFGYPSVRSVERVLTQLFTEAHRCFYWRSSDFECDKGIDEALAKSLRLSEDNPVFGRWQQGEFLELRRDVLWLTSRDWSFGATCRPEYVDPVDFLDWAVANRRFPRMLVGPAHGDLHGRNVIVGVVRGEAEWPAVFDFDRMSPTNLVAWDFAKLELELKCRLVEDLFIGEPDEAAVRRRLQLEDPRPTKEPVPMSPEELRTQRRADRLVVMLAFERKLHEWTTELSSKAQATTTGTSTEEESPENEPIGRALRIMFRIRREAAIYMGFERPGREQVWLDEYYFALAAYGVITAKWHSVDDHVAWALASAGVAAANLSLLPWPPKTDEAPSIPDCPTCFHLLPHAAARWNEGQSRRAIESLKSGLERFPYAVPLRRQLASSLIQSGSEAEEEEARRQIESLAGAAVVFRDYETLSQLGRIYKDAGDRFVDNATTCAESIARKSPSFQFYRSARLYYERAYELSGAYYPAVNAATLALLTGDREDAIRLANETLVICGDLRADRDDYVWILASQGEASLLLGRGDCAKMFYSAALQRLEPENVGVAKTMRDGLSRLRWGLGDDAVRLTLELFAQNVLLAGIGPSPFDAPRCERD